MGAGDWFGGGDAGDGATCGIRNTNRGMLGERLWDCAWAFLRGCAPANGDVSVPIPAWWNLMRGYKF